MRSVTAAGTRRALKAIGAKRAQQEEARDITSRVRHAREVRGTNDHQQNQQDPLQASGFTQPMTLPTSLPLLQAPAVSGAVAVGPQGPCQVQWYIPSPYVVQPQQQQQLQQQQQEQEQEQQPSQEHPLSSQAFVFQPSPGVTSTSPGQDQNAMDAETPRSVLSMPSPTWGAALMISTAAHFASAAHQQALAANYTKQVAAVGTQDKGAVKPGTWGKEVTSGDSTSTPVAVHEDGSKNDTGWYQRQQDNTESLL